MSSLSGKPTDSLMRIFRSLLLLGALLPSALLASESWKAGLARVPITPRRGLWMAGYAARRGPSQGVAQEIYAKALALEDATGQRSVLVTTDLLGFTAALAKQVAERAKARFGLPRDRLLFNSSHTHSGPVVGGMLRIAYSMTDEQAKDVETYTNELADKIVQVIGDALAALAPARLSFGQTEALFAVNRRVPTPDGYVGGVNRSGPVNRSVPILVIDGARGGLRGVVFGYACHNTTIRGDSYLFHGDYAGEAQAWLEHRYPGTVALFVAGCGADSNPHPRGTLLWAREHGTELASAVDKALTGPLTPVRGPLKYRFELLPLAFDDLPDRVELERRLKGDNPYVQLHAQEMLKILDREGQLPVEYPYPLQVWQFGSDLTFIAMAGEVVVDYDLRLKRELGVENLWVAGYSNDVFAYIPSLRVLREGGYEAEGAMIYYGQPSRFAPSVEATIMQKIREMVRTVRRVRTARPD